MCVLYILNIKTHNNMKTIRKTMCDDAVGWWVLARSCGDFCEGHNHHQKIVCCLLLSSPPQHIYRAHTNFFFFFFFFYFLRTYKYAPTLTVSFFLSWLLLLHFFNVPFQATTKKECYTHTHTPPPLYIPLCPHHNACLPPILAVALCALCIPVVSHKALQFRRQPELCLDNGGKAQDVPTDSQGASATLHIPEEIHTCVCQLSECVCVWVSMCLSFISGKRRSM